MDRRQAWLVISVILLSTQALLNLAHVPEILRQLAAGESGDTSVPRLIGMLLAPTVWLLCAWRQWATRGAWSLGIAIFAGFAVVVRTTQLIRSAVTDGTAALDSATILIFLAGTVANLGLLIVSCFFVRSRGTHPD